MGKHQPHDAPSGQRGLRSLVMGLFAGLHLLAVPCAMAMTSPAADEGCEHCDVVISHQPCLTAADAVCTDEAFDSKDRLRAPPRPNDQPSLILPPPVALAGLPRPTSPSGRCHRAGGRHSGDPPLNLLHCNFRE